ncbi:hypothetical protein HED63_24090 [Ochrobactrum cytisi]|nr:hypothetical protein [Brucella cytisi]
MAVLIMLGTPEASRAHSPQWWYVAEEADRVLFVDTGSIQREGDEIRYNSSLIVRDRRRSGRAARFYAGRLQYAEDAVAYGRALRSGWRTA